MYIPLFTPWLQPSTQSLERRKGGGGGGGGGHGGGGGGRGGGGRSSGTSGGSSSSGSVGRGPSIPMKSISNSPLTAKAYGSGTTKIDRIPSGQPFAGRSTGGATRSGIFGTRYYGSGYPGSPTPSVKNRDFPFGFWPITFGAAAGVGTAAEFHSHEYGDPNNSSRPGGSLYDAPFRPRNGTETYRILADNATVNSLIESMRSSCQMNTTLISAVPYNETDPTQPKPEQAIQYYRASSIVLTLDGYNNSVVYSNSTSAPNTPLPTTLDLTFFACLNKTIGDGAPLLDSAAVPGAHISGLVGLAWMAFYLLRWFA